MKRPPKVLANHPTSISSHPDTPVPIAKGRLRELTLGFFFESLRDLHAARTLVPGAVFTATGSMAVYAIAHDEFLRALALAGTGLGVAVVLHLMRWTEAIADKKSLPRPPPRRRRSRHHPPPRHPRLPRRPLPPCHRCHPRPGGPLDEEVAGHVEAEHLRQQRRERDVVRRDGLVVDGMQLTHS